VSNYVLHHAPCSVQIVHLPMSSQAAEVTSKTTTFSN
jgi:hypothetical protein